MLQPRKQVFVRLVVLFLFLALATEIVPRSVQAENSLPNFNLRNLNDAEIPSSQFAPREKWMLVYLEPNCSSCFELLKTFKQPEAIADLEQKIVIVVAGTTVNEAQKMAKKNAWIPAGAWYVDQNRAAMSSLNLKGLPMTIGFKRAREEWRLAGFPKQENAAQSILLNWCRE